MIGIFRGFVARLSNTALLLCCALCVLLTACSNPGVALNGLPVVQETVSTELGEAVQSPNESGSLDGAITGSGL